MLNLGVKFMYEAIVIGVSAGGLHALSEIIPYLPKDYPLAVIIVQHRGSETDAFLAGYLNRICEIEVKEALTSIKIMPGCVYIAPSGYHLLIERDKTFSLSVDPPVNFSIPSIDVLFQSAGACYKEKLIGMILTGANRDGSEGLKTIKEYGGLAIVQQPQSAEVDFMPKAAINSTDVDHIIPLGEIGNFLKQLKFNNHE